MAPNEPEPSDSRQEIEVEAKQRAATAKLREMALLRQSRKKAQEDQGPTPSPGANEKGEIDAQRA